MTEKIKILMIKRDITQKELSDLLDVSQPTLSKKFKLDDWRESDLYKIAESCNCRYEGNFLIGEEKNISDKLALLEK